MRFVKAICISVVIAVLIFVLAPKAGATITDERTILTFNQPVEIPGMVLPAGTYVFKVVDYAMGDRNVIEVLDKNETHVYGTFVTRPVVRLGREPLVSFAEGPAGARATSRRGVVPISCSSIEKRRRITANPISDHGFLFVGA